MLIYIAFVGVFILFLIESFYFYKKSKGSEAQSYEEYPPIAPVSRAPTFIKFAIPALVVLIIGGGVFMFVKNKKATPVPESTTTKVMEESIIPTSSPNPSTAPTNIALIITSIPTTSITKTLSNIPPPTVSKKVAELPRTGGGQEEDQTTSEPIIVPKMPLAGSVPSTVIYFFAALTTLAIGLML